MVLLFNLLDENGDGTIDNLDRERVSGELKAQWKSNLEELTNAILDVKHPAFNLEASADLLAEYYGKEREIAYNRGFSPKVSGGERTASVKGRITTTFREMENGQDISYREGVVFRQDKSSGTFYIYNPKTGNASSDLYPWDEVRNKIAYQMTDEEMKKLDTLFNKNYSASNIVDNKEEGGGNVSPHSVNTTVHKTTSEDWKKPTATLIKDLTPMLEKSYPGYKFVSKKTKSGKNVVITITTPSGKTSEFVNDHWVRGDATVFNELMKELIDGEKSKK